MKKNETYTINKLAKIAGISSRTLRHYDHIGLLTPSSRSESGLRLYSRSELLKLQQILFFKELEFSLQEISNILENNLDLKLILKEHKNLLKKEIERLQILINTVDNTILNIKNNTMSKTDDLYKGFSKVQIEEYKKEAKDRWGDTDAYKESQKRVNNMSKEQMVQIQKSQVDVGILMSELKDLKQPGEKEVQDVVRKHFEQIKIFYTPTKEIYLGLGQMYVEDERFKKFYDKHGEGTAEFLNEAMKIFSKEDKNFK